MHSFIKEILSCCCMGNPAQSQYNVLEGQSPIHEKKGQGGPQSIESLAADILSTLYAANTNDEHLEIRLQDIVHETGWYEGLAAAVLDGLENALQAEVPMGQAVKDAYEKAKDVTLGVLEFGKEHPVFFAVVALGILVIFAPWAVEALGFGELGPIAGTFAAGWQARYAGYVPARSLFSFFQRLGMIWK